MKTTIYELLGMIKDDKFVKRILFRNRVYEYEEDGKDYYNEEYGWIFDEYDLISILNEPIEILETTITLDNSFNYLQKLNEDEIPNKIEKIEESAGITIYDLGLDICNIKNKINEIIEVINER